MRHTCRHLLGFSHIDWRAHFGADRNSHVIGARHIRFKNALNDSDTLLFARHGPSRKRSIGCGNGCVGIRLGTE